MPTLQWVGKDKVVNHHLDVPFRVLNKVSSFRAPEGTPANSTDNRIIHGDNLEALKSLLPEFEGMVKIGFSNDLRRRIREYPPTARLLAVEHGSRRLERQRLEQFYEYRTARKEWHKPGSKLMAHIQELQAVNQAA